MDNKFESGGGEQNTGIGDHAIGKQVNNFFCRLLGRIFTTGNQSPAIIAEKGHVTVTYNNSVIPPQRLEELAGQLAVTEAALASFFKILEEQQVPPGDLDSKLREIAANYKELLARVGDDQTAKQTIEAGDYAKAEQLLEDVAKQQSIAAAEANADLAKLQEVQLRYAKAAAYWQKAAALLPEDKKKERALYLHEAGYDFHRVARYSEALSLYEQSLVIRREIGDKAGEGVTLNNISQIYSARGDSATALTYLEQSLMITQEIGNRAVEGTTLNNISQIYHARGDYTTALTYLEQSLVIRREIGDKEGEGTTLNNISQIYDARGDYTTALTYLEQSLVIHWEVGNRTMEGTTLSNIGALHHAKGDALTYLEQSLSIRREIGDRRGEAETSWNIGIAYIKQGDLSKAEPYISRAVQLAEELGHPKLEEWRKALEDIRAKLRGK
ncbi:MAG: Tetratricopeptide repeat-containing protein [Candidatus Electronema aureum]|uniref:Tetratricopeptide repeat-containing protein n=1 Tax=Candidatus Electronema aureum TaxID=2005002 RepID=A0A521G115_9BACT|nr:MAG: Tetratricopeptide repeat-containing protein [Candidatus Electronema aureum]